MSDQPKPTTDQIIAPTKDFMEAQCPTAAAQEWTVEGKAIWNDCQPVGIATSSQEAHQIADAHNAALAAEREREEFDWGHVKREYLRLQKENAKLQEQLAAEREKWQEPRCDFVSHLNLTDDIQQR